MELLPVSDYLLPDCKSVEYFFHLISTMTAGVDVFPPHEVVILLGGIIYQVFLFVTFMYSYRIRH